MKALILSHAHPTFSIGGAQVASYNLFNGLKAQANWNAHYLAGVGPPVARHRATPLLAVGDAPDETLFWSDDFDWFHLGARELDDLSRHFERLVSDLRPDVVNFHHVMGFGIQAIRAVRRALGDVPIVYTLHEYLPICANHGQMIKAKSGACACRPPPRNAASVSRRSARRTSCAANCSSRASSPKSTPSSAQAVSCWAASPTGACRARSS